MEYTAVDATGFGVEGSEPLSLMTHVDLDVLLPESKPTEAGVVAWSPPTPNWNPWTGANIDEGKWVLGPSIIDVDPFLRFFEPPPSPNRPIYY